MNIIKVSGDMVFFDNEEWTHTYSDYFKHGQHSPKMYGSCGYVNWHLIDVVILKCYKNLEEF